MIGFMIGVLMTLSVMYIGAFIYKQKKDKEQKEVESTRYYKAQQVALAIVDDIRDGRKSFAKIKYDSIEAFLNNDI